MSQRLIIGVVLLLIAGGIIAVVVATGGDSDDSDSSDNSSSVITLNGYIGSEKVAFLRNPEVVRILRERYGIEVDFQDLGSIAQVDGSVDTTEMDFLWPSNEVALALYEERNPGAVSAETIFNSPIVLYSWDFITEALIDQGLVTENPGAYYEIDMPRLVANILAGQQWSEIGISEFSGNIKVESTDPRESNSGNMFYGLLANLLVEQETGNEIATSESIVLVLPTMKDYLDGLGTLETGSGDLFKKYITQGSGSKPIIVGYESQLIEFSLQNNPDPQLRILYPRPTVWSSHPLIALTPEGERLIEALSDPEIQQIGWTEHGFRSGLASITSDPADLDVSGIPETITSVRNLPSPQVMEYMKDYLEGDQQ